MAFVLPPPKTKAQSGQQEVFKAYVNAHPGLKPWAQGIYRYALDYGVDPVFFASLINTESKGDPKAVSSKGAIGLGQIMPLHVGDPIPWAPGRRLTLKDIQNPTTNLRYSAYFFSTKLSQAGNNYDAAYRGAGGYNPGGPAIFHDVPKTYVPTTTAKSPTDAATTSVETAAARADLTASWAVLDKTGKVKFVTTANPPKGTLKVFGTPITKQGFLQQYASITDDYLAYTNKRPSFAQAALVIKHGTSQFQLRANLAKDPGFVGSPVWKQNAPGYTAVWHQVYGDKATPDTKAIAAAVANNVGAGAFQDQLRHRTDYSTSNEYKQSYAANQNVFAQIYGQPQEADHATIDMAVKNGYDSNQFAAYLRQQPQWKSSAEAQSLYYGLANRLGLIEGKQTVLQNG